MPEPIVPTEAPKPVVPSVPDVTKITTELAAAHSVLETQKVRIAELEAAGAEHPALKNKVEKSTAYLTKLLASAHAAAPEPIREKFPLEAFATMDPLLALEQLEGASTFYTEMKAKILVQYNIKEAIADPTKKADGEKPQYDTSTHAGLLGLAISLIDKKK